MAAPRFFVATPIAPSPIGSEFTLPDAVAHHALRVRRLAPGDAITLFDGTGGEYAATLDQAGRRDARVRLDAFVDGIAEPARAVVLAPALVATDTMDTIVRHAVELGATAIEPLLTARSARFPTGAQGIKRLAHWRAIAIAACEQCGRNRVPAVDLPLPLAAWIAQRAAPRSGIVLAPEAGAPWSRLRIGAGDLDVVVGPEGGLTVDEDAAAVAAGLVPLRLGARILRAETAALAALALVASTADDR